jgi:hypothetical protein
MTAWSCSCQVLHSRCSTAMWQVSPCSTQYKPCVPCAASGRALLRSGLVMTRHVTCYGVLCAGPSVSQEDFFQGAAR